MGSSPSRYEETDWSEADGGLTSATDTVDGSEPTATHVQITISPKVTLPLVGRNLVAAREYDVKDASNQVLFETKKVADLEKGFDLLKDGETVLRVDANYTNRTWHISQVGTPVFEGQHPDPKPLEKTGQELYRKASVFYDKKTNHTGVVNMFRDNDDVDEILKVERCEPTRVVKPKWQFQTMRLDNSQEQEQQQQPLVGFWKWEGSLIPLTKDEQMVMDLAKGSDLALHVVLAVLATIERSSVKAEYTG